MGSMEKWKKNCDFIKRFSELKHIVLKRKRLIWIVLLYKTSNYYKINSPVFIFWSNYPENSDFEVHIGYNAEAALFQELKKLLMKDTLITEPAYEREL